MQLNVSLEEAQRLLLQNLISLPVERLPLLQAGGRVLAEKVVVAENLPARALAARDGYVVHRDDLKGQKTLSITGSSPAERLPLPLQKGETFEVATGAVIPENAAALVPYEEADVREKKVYLGQAIADGSFIRPVGEDFRTGELLAQPGDVITPGLLSALAALGKSELAVYPRPRVAVLSLGNRLVSWEREPAFGEMRDSNGPLLVSQAIRDGAHVTAAGAVDAKAGELVTRMREIMAEADLLLTIGGTYAREQAESSLLFHRLGGEILFWGVPIQPGGHNGAAVCNKKMLISLSGNPAACAVGYELLAAPVIRALQKKEPYCPRVEARCLDAVSGKGGRRFVRAHLTADDGNWKVKVLPGQKPGMIRSLINCNALIDLPAGSPAVEAGTAVSVIILDTSSIWF
ncbi:molybdopterin molybdotransferase MoeA [Syntrophomonas curvata]